MLFCPQEELKLCFNNNCESVTIDCVIMLDIIVTLGTVNFSLLLDCKEIIHEFLGMQMQSSAVPYL